MDKIIKNPTVILNWSDWYKWDELKLDAGVNADNRIKVPNKQPGVYEAKYDDEDQRLINGKTSNLCFRIIQELDMKRIVTTILDLYTWHVS